MQGYKGFDNNLKCRNYPYKIGETFIHENTPNLCENGFHFCENPMDVFRYYSPSNSRYAEVEAENVTDQKDSDSKRVCSELIIKAEIGLSGIISAGVKFILEKINFKDSAATNTGNYSAATNTGDHSAATNTGDKGCAISIGIKGKARGALGCWLTLAEWKQAEDHSWHRVNVKTVIVDGKKIKPNIFYKLKRGKFTKAGE